MMQPWNGEITQSLKWMQNNAPNIQSLILQKKDWYEKNHKQFWADWEDYVFDLDTANNFGLMIWCIILGVPSQLFGLYPPNSSWAYGEFRQNYVYSGTPGLPDPNMQGGNFYGGGEFTLLTSAEIRIALKLRYAMLVSNARIEYVNRMLNWIWNKGEPWDTASGKYARCMDATADVSPSLGAFQIEYHFGPGMNLSPQFINLLNETQYGILPQFAGSKVIAIQD